MGFGGMSAVLIAMVSALTLAPALLAMLGPKVDSLSLRPLFRRVFRRDSGAKVATSAPDDHGVWARIAHSVMRRPVIYTVGVAALLIALSLPFLRVEFGGVDERVLPAGTESRVVSETSVADFPPSVSGPIQAVVTLADPVDSPPARPPCSPTSTPWRTCLGSRMRRWVAVTARPRGCRSPTAAP